MATANETVAEIVREMREAGRPPKVGACESPDDYVVVHKFVIDWADRIEAAHGREILVERHLADEYFAAKDDERLTIVANYENVIKDLVRNISAKDAEIAKLRTLTTRTDNSEVIAELQRRLKVAEDALEAASDAFCFCIEQCELELGTRMIFKLCDDGKAVEHALAAIRGERN